MTWSRDSAAWLREELDEALVSMGYVGLYEAIWSLNASSFDLDERQKRELARSVVAELIADPAAGLGLYLLTWPGANITAGPLPASTLDDGSAWEAGDLFVALVQPEFVRDEQGIVASG